MPRTLCLSILCLAVTYARAKRDTGDAEDSEDSVLLAVGAGSELAQYEPSRDAAPGLSLLAVSTRTGKAAVTEAGADVDCHGLPEHTPSFEAFVRKYNRSYSGPKEHRQRLALYQARVATIRKQNCRVGSWTATVNHLSDRSHEELQQLHGWKGAAKDHPGGGAFSFLQTGKETNWHFDYMSIRNRLHHHEEADEEESDAIREFRHEVQDTRDHVSIAHTKDWRSLRATSTALQQGSCGSCWAFATATLLGAHSELYGQQRTFSPQHLIQCVSNTRKCGGTGGCDGATVELGLDHVVQHGLATDEDLPYTGKEAPCFDGPTPHVEGHKVRESTKGQKLNSAFNAIAALLQKKSKTKQVGDQSQSVESKRDTASEQSQVATKTKTEVKAQAVYGLIGWENPLHNNYHALMRALQDGPVAVALQATDSWYHYGGGIVGDDCPMAATINHATVLVGYGERSAGDQYWLIQNSWGPAWGENGFLRLRRRGQDEDRYCGWDRNPQLGNGCQGGPSKVWVCGTCGILYDPVRPVFKK